MQAENKTNGRLTLLLLTAGVISFAAMTVVVPGIGAGTKGTSPREKKITAGAYYFDGWAGRNEHAGEANETWARNSPTHLTRRMVEEFPEREPV